MLDPPLSLEEESELISKTLLVVSKLPPAEQTTIDSIRDNYERIVRSLFEKTPNTAILDRVLEHISKYLIVKEEETRKRAIKLFYATLENFFDACAPGEDVEVPFPCHFASSPFPETFGLLSFRSPSPSKPTLPPSSSGLPLLFQGALTLPRRFVFAPLSASENFLVCQSVFFLEKKKQFFIYLDV